MRFMKNLDTIGKKQISLVLEGISGQQRIKRMMQSNIDKNIHIV